MQEFNPQNTAKNPPPKCSGGGLSLNNIDPDGI